MIVLIIVKANSEYELQLTLAGFENFSAFWANHDLILKLLASGMSLAIAGYTLTHALHIATVNSLKDLRERFNESGKKSFHLFLMKSSEYPADDKSDSNLAERIVGSSLQADNPVEIANQTSFNSADILDYLGIIELGGIMLKRKLITLEEFYNQFGYRLEYLLSNQQIAKHIYNDAGDYYKELHSIIERLGKVGLLKVNKPVTDTRIYKYYSAQSYNIDAFRKNQIFFSRPSKLNDPFDASSRLIEPYKKFCSKINWDSQKATNLDNHGVCSFSESELPDNKHLWALYADACRGFVLEFDRYVLTDRLPQQYRIPVYLQKVEYGYEPLNLDKFDSKFLLNGDEYTLRGCIQDTPIGLDRIFQYLHLYKDYEVWHLENESRMIVGNLRSKERLKPIDDKGYLLTLPQNTIKSLTIGANMSREIQKELLNIAEQNNIPVYLATPEIKSEKWIISIKKYTDV